MKKLSYIPLLGLLVYSFFITSCSSMKKAKAAKEDSLVLKIKEKRDVINAAYLKEQPAPSFTSRGAAASRGLLPLDLANGLVSLSTNAIQKMIDNNKKKYTIDYQFGLTDLYFYDQPSNDGVFDPTGMQFNGFTLVRSFKNKEGKDDTAFTVSFVVDTSNMNEIINNAQFRLRLKDFTLKHAKAKIDKHAEKKLNMDVEIAFKSSYVNEHGLLFDNVTLGTFYLLIRDAPIDPKDPGYDAYYEGLKGKLLTGKSFIVPRSSGYHMEHGSPRPGFSQGLYSIDVKVKETSKSNFVNKMIIQNSSTLVSGAGNGLKSVL